MLATERPTRGLHIDYRAYDVPDRHTFVTLYRQTKSQAGVLFDITDKQREYIRALFSNPCYVQVPRLAAAVFDYAEPHQVNPDVLQSSLKNHRTNLFSLRPVLYDHGVVIATTRNGGESLLIPLPRSFLVSKHESSHLVQPGWIAVGRQRFDRPELLPLKQFFIFNTVQETDNPLIYKLRGPLYPFETRILELLATHKDGIVWEDFPATSTHTDTYRNSFRVAASKMNAAFRSAHIRAHVAISTKKSMLHFW